MITSACTPASMAATVASSITRLKATMPPKAERSSQAKARSYAVAASSATATPQGLACLMMAQAGLSAEESRARS